MVTILRKPLIKVTNTDSWLDSKDSLFHYLGISLRQKTSDSAWRKSKLLAPLVKQ